MLFGAHHHQYADDVHLYIFASKEEWTAGVDTTTPPNNAWIVQLAFAQRSDAPSIEVRGNPIQFVQARCTKDVGNITVADANIALVSSIKSLGVIMDSHLTFDVYVAAVNKAFYLHIQTLRHIRASLLDDDAV